MFKYYCPVDDAITYFTSRLNRLRNVADFMKYICKKNPAMEKKLERSLRPALELEKKIGEAFKSLNKSCDFFFKNDKAAVTEADQIFNPALLLFGYRAGWGAKSRTFDGLVKELHDMPQHSRDMLFISYIYDLNGFESIESVPKISDQNSGNLIETMRGANLNQSTRTRLIELYVNFNEHVDHVYELLRPAVDVIIQNEALYKDAVLKNEAEIDAAGGLRAYVQEKFKFSMKANGEHCLHLGVLSPDIASVRDGIFESMDVFIGVNVNELLMMLYSGQENQKLSTLFKLLSDETRLEILRNVCKRPMYGLEIAETFSISAPTVSYHMRKLGLSGFTESYFEGGRTYYRANFNNIRGFGNSFMQFFGVAAADESSVNRQENADKQEK